MSKTSIEWRSATRVAEVRTSGATMGTRYSARFVAPAAADAKAIAGALEEAVTAVDRQMSNWVPDSDLSRLNHAALGAWTPIPANLATVLQRAAAIGRETNHAFHIGVGDLVDDWGFGPARMRRLQRLPAQPRARAPIDTLIEVDLAGFRARKHGPVTLDLCGIAKGFGVDELGRVLDANGIKSWLVGIDGELRARGTRPDGLPWAIALESPEDDRRAAMGVIELSDAALATSGDYRHWAEVGGRRISHTMDPRTGAPVLQAPASVTVCAATCMDADAYATALMVLGESPGIALATRLGLDALLVMREEGGFRTAGAGCFDKGSSACAITVAR